VVSAAYGGFSNVWGAQVMPFAASVFDDWPVSSAEMEPHYRRILGEIPYAGEIDDLSDHFPLLADARALPPLSARSQRVLASYARRRQRIRSLGITLGKARLAFAADDCVRCGLCMTGCPYRLIYSASQTFDALRAAGCVTYRSGLFVTGVSESTTAATVEAVELASETRQVFEADRVYLACGAIGTTQIVARSLGILGTPIAMRESRQFTLPFVSAAGTIDPRVEPQFTLNQFNLTVGFDDRAYDLSQLHFYTFNPLFEQALPAPLRARLAGGARRELLRRLSFAIGYLPSWQSPSLRLTMSETDGLAPRVEISSRGTTYTNPMLRRVVNRLVRAAPMLDLYPVLPMLRVAGAAKSYHFGGSFPHSPEQGRLTTDRLGRPAAWERIHLVDGSVFPSVPATTFTLTVMANAHRIATESLVMQA
jgi:ferredoxin